MKKEFLVIWTLGYSDEPIIEKHTIDFFNSDNGYFTGSYYSIEDINNLKIGGSINIEVGQTIIRLK